MFNGLKNNAIIYITFDLIIKIKKQINNLIN